MFELTLVLTAINGAAIGTCLLSMAEQRRLRRALTSSVEALAADRETLRAAAEANSSVTAELLAQRDRLAGLEMRLGTVGGRTTSPLRGAP